MRGGQPKGPLWGTAVAKLKVCCPKCGTPHTADESLPGKAVRCARPDCGQHFRLTPPDPGPPAVGPPAPPPPAPRGLPPPARVTLTLASGPDRGRQFVFAERTTCL